ncbi:MAG: hypothetical protein JW817_02385 [Clostridiales bacterium]|nr:hypothetical protein [Clostridiales bacterium]
MKLVPTIRYNVQDIITKTIPVYYGVFTLIFLTLFSMSKLTSLYMAGSFSGASFNSTVLIVVIGFVYTRSSFRYLTQMGVSKRTQITGKVISILLISAVAVVMDRLLELFAEFLFKSTEMTYEGSGIAFSLFDAYLSKLGPVAREMTLIGLGYTSRVMLLSATVFIAMLYVRMNTAAKVIVSVGIPVLAFVGMPALAMLIPEQMAKLIHTIAEITGLSNGLPIRSILWMTGGTVIFMMLYSLITRRAPIKD